MPRLQDFAGWHEGRANLTGGSEPLVVSVDHTTTNFFAVLGTPALVGRTFTADADLSRVEPEAVLSYALWQRRYGGDPQIIGRSIILDTQPLTIVGVMPARFAIRTNELAESRADLWIPLPLDRTSDAGILTVVARVTSGIALTQAQAELSLMTQHLERGTPYYALHWTWGAVPLLKATVQDVRLTLLVLFGSVSILLMLVCANVATLLLSRGISRQPEFGVRLSLGATPGRLRRQLLSESAAVAALAGVLGILVAYWGTRTLLLIVPPGLDLPRTKEIGMDLRVFGFATAVTTMTAVVFGLVPSVTTTGFGPSSLHQAARGSSASRTQVRLGSGLIVTEVALALVLLVGAGLLVRSFSMLLRVSPGFQPDAVLTMRTTLPASAYDTDDRRRAFSQELLTRLARLPGMAHVGLTNYLPLTRFGIAYRFEIAGHPEARVDDQKFAWVSVVGGHYFEAMGIPWWPQIPGSNVTVVARTTAQPRTMAGPMASQITEVDRNQAVGDVRSMQDVVGAELDHPRFTMQLLGGFAGTAALLAAIELYSVIAVGVTRRTRELGIRIALAAQPQNVLRLAMQRGLVLLGTGLVVGLPVTMALDRLMAGLLYGITPTDPVTLIAAALLLAVVGMVSTSLPAWRATQIDPVVALQAE